MNSLYFSNSSVIGAIFVICTVAKQFTLGRNERLKSRKQIEQLFKEGKTFNTFPFRIFYTQTPVSLINNQSLTNLQFGAAVSTKNFKRATDRNRIKRLTREAWRIQKKELEVLLKTSDKQLNVFFIYTAKELPEYNFVYEKAGFVISKLIKIINENNSVGS